MSFFTIVLFFVYTFCLGLTASFFVKNSENFLERNLMRIGYGLGLLPFLAIILNLFKVPADWRIILAISLLYPVYHVFRNRKNLKLSVATFKITKTDISIFVMLLIFAAALYVYATGAFKYPYLEDDDSWGHAEGIRFMSAVKNVFSKEAHNVRYLNPYPPTYDILFGILHQTNDSVYWTMKFFNALVISLSIIFFYFFIKEFSGNRNKALFATFALASVPAFMSHFIWALALTIPLFFVSFYAIERIKHDKKWRITAGLVMFTAFTSSPTHSTYFGLFLALYLIAKMILEKKILVYHILASVFGLMLSFVFWWLPMILRYGVKGTIQGVGFSFAIKGAKMFSGTGDRVYNFADFFFAQKQNMINSPIGIGIVLSILTIVGIIFLLVRFKELLKHENHWLAITFVWFIFTLYAVNAAKFTIKLSPFRTWMLFAIPVCILASEGTFNLMSLAKGVGGNIGKYAILLLLIIGIYFTSAQQKIAVNTAVWPPGGFWTSGEEIAGYLWMKENLKPNAKVFGFVIEGPVIGLDKYICSWCEDEREFKKIVMNKTAQDINSFLKSKGYQYMIIDGQFARKYGANETNNKLNEISQSNLFKPVFGNNAFILLQIT
ncbi:hypothetical protein HYX02_00960 [Candidatus Woesearchaeota archaeon]|nr:hypothetical protein [Candidatus Woesearchaeota archaeon]